MTASLFVTGTGVGNLGTTLPPGRPSGGAGHVVHAVATPVVDGLDASVCGVLVTAAAAEDWPSAAGIPRCAECARIAG